MPSVALGADGTIHVDSQTPVKQVVLEGLADVISLSSEGDGPARRQVITFQDGRALTLSYATDGSVKVDGFGTFGLTPDGLLSVGKKTN